jgi:DNA-3-methyladenine glycosylase I
MPKQKQRCAWVTDDEIYIHYHDHIWGKPLHDDQSLFEMLILEGMQAGLSWLTILKKRNAFKEAFDQFDIDKILCYTDEKVDALLQNKGIIRNRLKIRSVIENAKVYRKVQNEFGSFDNYLWGFIKHTPILNTWQSIKEVPAKTDLSDQISKDLKKRGFKFVGSTIVYAYMQAIGMVNDHTKDCFLYHKK